MLECIELIASKGLLNRLVVDFQVKGLNQFYFGLL